MKKKNKRKKKREKKEKMQIRAYVRRLEKFLQQRFNKLNLSLYVNRRSKYVHIELDIPLLSTRASSELVAIIKNFKRENKDPKYIFLFPNSYILQSGSMVISYLKEKILCRREDRNRAKNVKFINKSGKKIESEIIFSRCYGVILLTIDLEGFEFYHSRLVPINW